MNKITKINFILPFKARRPAGGIRIMYEYANRLAKKGYKVHLTYPIRTPFMKYRLPYIMRYMLFKIEGFKRNKWFDFDPSITMSYVPEVKDKYVADADIVIATWWATVLDMGKLSKSKGKKINLIQGFENWTGHEELLYSSYKMKDTSNIVIVSYLEDIVKQHSNNPLYLIPNGIDEQHYCLKEEIEKRVPAKVIMNYSIQEIKGSIYGLKALYLVKEKYPDLQVELFGVCTEPKDLPDWINFYRNPNNLVDIYNRNAIFISNSFTEGCSLVSMEALFCGCALICTDIPGPSDYAIENQTALLTEVKNATQMADRICYLIENNEERIRLAKEGNRYIQRFTWQHALEKIEVVFNSL